MTKRSEWKAQSRLVVGGTLHNRHTVDNRIIAVVLAFVLTVALACMMPLQALADESPSPSASTSQSSQSSTDAQEEETEAQLDSSQYITDPQNLLGDNLTKVIDAINTTKQDTGVTVRLLYLESFNTKEQPEKWAANLLESLNPAANTVMLAVASHDGNLVVVVSPNSDEWLRRQSTVDQLSEAASKPLLEQKSGQDPNWSQSAIDMMEAVRSAKSTSTTSKVSIVSIIIMAVVLVALIVVVIVMIFVRRKREVDNDSKQAEKSAEHTQADEKAPETNIPTTITQTTDDASADNSDEDENSDGGGADSDNGDDTKSDDTKPEPSPTPRRRHASHARKKGLFKRPN